MSTSHHRPHRARQRDARRLSRRTGISYQQALAQLNEPAPETEFQFPSAEHPAAVELTDEHQDELASRVMAGEADESHFADDEGVARLGTIVILEYEGRIHCERYPTQPEAIRRYNELNENLIVPEITDEDDQQPAGEQHCYECGRPVIPDSSPGVWVHDPATLGDQAYDLDEQHPPRPEQESAWPW